jgi:Glycine zipper 2TM domain
MIRSQRTNAAAFGAAALFALAIACDVPQDSDAQPAAEQGATSGESSETMDAPVVPAGTEILIRLAESVSTADDNAGDSFDAVVVDEVSGSDGAVVIPAGSAASGTVVQSHQSTGPQDPAVIAIRFESIEFNDETIPLDATVVSAEPSTSTGSTTAETAGRIAVGAAAGAILGQIIGKDTKSTIAGAGAGAVAGAVVALSTRKGNATLESGSVVRVRLNEPIPPR